MAATDRRTIALIAAGLGAFAPSLLRADGTLDFKFLHYGESDDRTQVSNPELFWQQDFGERGQLGLLLGYDAISGASPTGEVPSLDAASGASASASDIPMVEYSDTRQAATGSYSIRLGSHLPSVSLSVSEEEDYLSRGGSLSDAWDLFDRRSTLHFGAGITRDRIEPVNMTETFHKEGTSFSVGWTQVLGPRDLIDLSYGMESLEGYLTDPYKLVTVGDVTMMEIRPEHRRRQSALIKYGHYFLSRGASKIAYRYYRDDWNVRAHTLDLTHDQRMGDHFILTPRVRLYQQGGAEFFAYEFDEAQEHMSSDYRLSAFWSWLAGIGFTVEINDHFAFNLSGTYMDQTGDDRVTPRTTVVAPAAIAVAALVEDEDGEDDGPGDLSPADMQVVTVVAGFAIRY